MHRLLWTAASCLGVLSHNHIPLVYHGGLVFGLLLLLLLPAEGQEGHHLKRGGQRKGHRWSRIPAAERRRDPEEGLVLKQTARGIFQETLGQWEEDANPS